MQPQARAIEALTPSPTSIRPSSCAPASRWRQGQALRVLRNLDPAGRGRAMQTAGSEGMPLSPHQGNGNAEASTVSFRGRLSWRNLNRAVPLISIPKRKLNCRRLSLGGT